MHHSNQFIYMLLNGARKDEENRTISTRSFSGSISKIEKIVIVALCVIGLGLGIVLCFPLNSPNAGVVLLALGVIALLGLPTYLSYRCFVDAYTLKAEYYILCFKVKKEVLWKDIRYKKVKRDKYGEALSIHLYNTDRKKLISFDCGIVGFDHIVKLVNRKGVLKL